MPVEDNGCRRQPSSLCQGQWYPWGGSLKKNCKSLYSASIWRTIRCAIHMFRIALMFKVHGALKFIVFNYFNIFSWFLILEETGVPGENPCCQVGTINPTDMS